MQTAEEAHERALALEAQKLLQQAGEAQRLCAEALCLQVEVCELVKSDLQDMRRDWRSFGHLDEDSRTQVRRRLQVSNDIDGVFQSMAAASHLDCRTSSLPLGQNVGSPGRPWHRHDLASR